MPTLLTSGMTDLHITLDSALGTFGALVVMEALVKPIARQTGRWVLYNLDHRFPFIPNWLSGHREGE